MPTNIQQTDLDPLESSSFQYHYQTQKKDILLVQRDWNAKAEKDARVDWGVVCEPNCNVETNERGLRLLEFATFNN